MKAFIISCIALVIVLTSFTCSNSPGKNIAGENSTTGNGFAVVELFTSEGCSSCPPADAAVAKILTEYKSNVYVLGYHVDYWDNLGWKDAFSNADYTRRQRIYGIAFQLSSVYTPQVVINGAEQFVGSDNARLHNAINKDLKQPATENLSITAISKDDKTVTVSYKTNSSSQNLNVALVQSMAQSKIQRGENSGAILHHANIVRNIKTILLNSGDGNVTFTLPEGLSAKDCNVIAFIQNANDLKITAAAKTRIE